VWEQRWRLGRGRSFVNERSHNSCISACPSVGGEPQREGLGPGGADKAGQAGTQSMNPRLRLHEIYESIEP